MKYLIVAIALVLSACSTTKNIEVLDADYIEDCLFHEELNCEFE